MMELIGGLVIGLHLGTWHSEPGFNNVNPGVYVKTEQGWTAGAYYNSERNLSAYAGRTFETEGKTFGLTLGAITGYRNASVMPLVVPSMRLGSDALAARITFVPKVEKGGAHALHLSVERKF